MYMKSGNTITGKPLTLPKSARIEGKRLPQEGGGTKFLTETLSNAMDGLLSTACSLHYLKKISISYSATQGERLRYRHHFILKWEEYDKPW